MRFASFRRAALIAIGFSLFAIQSRAENPPVSATGETSKAPPLSPVDPLIKDDPLAGIMDPWYSMKDKLDRDYNLKIDGGYTLHFQYANETISDRNNEFGGRFDLGAVWTPLHYNQKDFGQVVFLMRSSENIGMRQDYALSDDAGSIMGTNSLHGGGEQIPISVNQLYWRQTFFDAKVAYSIGKLHPNNWIDLSPIANDETKQFMAGAYTGNESNPGQGLWTPGVALEFNLTQNVYINAVIANGLGQTATSGLNTLDEGKFYEAAEIGYKTAPDAEHPGNYRLTVWHNDREGGEGYGGSVGFDQEICDGWSPFARIGHGEKDATNITDFVSLGVANIRPFERRGDMFGIAGTYARPSDSSLREELLFETFYRIQLTRSMQFSPDVQYIVHPAFQPDVDSVVILGARLNWSF